MTKLRQFLDVHPPVGSKIRAWRRLTAGLGPRAPAVGRPHSRGASRGAAAALPWARNMVEKW
jgi:hypothetical protein